jgi:hypothetical protein
MLLFLAASGSTLTLQGQRVKYVKGLATPSQVKEGDILKIGQVVSTTPKGRIILVYSWATLHPQYPCEAYWILNGGLVKTVPDLKKRFGGESPKSGMHIENCGYTNPDMINAAFSDQATGTSVIAFSSNPGKGRGEGLSWRNIEFLQKINSAIANGVARLPRTFAGKLHSVAAGKILIEDETGKSRFSGTYGIDLRIDGVKSIRDLVQSNVYVEYTIGEPNKVTRIISASDQEFYQFLGFQKQISYSQNCEQRPAGTFCLKFDDGYVWLVEGKEPVRERPQLRFTLVIQKAVSDDAEYQHLAGTSYVMKIPHRGIEEFSSLP